MINESVFSKINKVNDIPQKKEYSDEEITERLSQGVDLDNDFALYLLEKNEIKLLIRNIDKFQNLNQEIALKLIESSEGCEVADNLEKFQGLNQEVAMRLINDGRSQSVAWNLKKFKGLNQEVAMMLIKNGEEELITNNLDKFESLDVKEIAISLIGVGLGDYVIKKIDNFKGLKYPEVALMLIKANQWAKIASNLEKFQELNLDQEVALNLIKDNWLNAFDNNIKKFKNLSREIAFYLIEHHRGYLVARNLDKFRDLDQEVAMRLINDGDSEFVADNLSKFKGLNQEVAFKLLEAKHSYCVFRSIEEFQGLELDQEFALKLIECDCSKVLIENLAKFKGLNQEVAMMFIKTGEGYLVVNNLNKFQDLNHQQIALKLIELGSGSAVASNLNKFQGLNQEVVLKLIELGSESAVANNLNKFQGLNQEVALKLIETGYWSVVIKNLEKFQDLNYSDIAFKIIEFGDLNAREDVALNLEKFQGLNHQKVASKLIEFNCGGYCIAPNLEKFQGLNHQELALKLIELGDGNYVVDDLEKFQGLNYQEIVLKLIECGDVNGLADNLDKFQGLNHKDIASSIVKMGKLDELASNLDKFQGLNHQEIALKLIESGLTKSIAENLDKFQLSPEKLYQAVKEKYYDFITKVETKFPKLAEQSSKSTELLLDVLNIKDNFSKLEKNISDNPFLLEALEENPRYGSKLILKYQGFDDTSKNNIKELFDNESKILKNNPNIDKDSVEFRKLMQEKLTSHVDNKEILEELENHDVNTQEWLNYDKQTYFTLGESEDVKFSDQIKTPITRIKETLNKYQDSIINVLSDYKTELQESFIPNPELEELKQKISKQKSRIASETDEKRIQGMQRGLVSLEAKEATLKPASVWSKVQSDIFRLKSMIDNIFKFHDACTDNETKIENTKDRKELIKEKDNLEKNKTQLRDNFKEFELFFESCESKLQELISPSLGQERSEALLQEIKETIGEELNHYDTDKNTLKNIFNEKPENENKLNGREMKISISSRSTQDLYLGNYCPCCVRIDSEYHGAESPISDYVTDLGMQNIVVYDEKTNSPVVVCWTFIGEDSPNGKPIMVIDNIEANTDYTNNYPGQLKEVISKYINDYAKSVNIKTIIQGPHNNDLIVFPLGSVGQKLGGRYNRESGYFLEAEIDDEEDDDWEDEDDDN